MKKRIFIGIFIIVFILLLNFIYFVATFGMYSDNVPSLGEKISAAFTNPLWLSPFYIIVIIQSNLVLTLFLIVLIVILYYLYDSFIRNKKVSNTDLYGNSTQVRQSNRAFKKFVLWGTLAITVWVAFVFSISSGPGEGMVGLIFLLPVMPIIYIFYPVYFIILSVRYSREKSGMDPLDKIMFYILAVPIISMGAFSVYKVYSGNLIQETFKSSAAKQVVEKQAGPADLVIKDIYYNKVDSIIISYCNESTNATVKGIAMKIEANKIISNNPGSYYPLLQAGECDTARAFL